MNVLFFWQVKYTLKISKCIHLFILFNDQNPGDHTSDHWAHSKTHCSLFQVLCYKISNLNLFGEEIIDSYFLFIFYYNSQNNKIETLLDSVHKNVNILNSDSFTSIFGC